MGYKIMDRYVKQYQLSDSDIKKIAGSRQSSNIFVIGADNKSDLYRIFHDGQIRIAKIILHYQTAITNGSRNGHWTALVINKPKKRIDFFDSYGELPDNQLNHINLAYRKHTGQDSRDVGIFLAYAMDRGFKIYYNNHRFQKLSDVVNTCGRWVAGYFKFSDGDADKFWKYINHIKNLNEDASLDDTITSLTNNYLG